MQHHHFHGKKALVTGATQGIGRAITEALIKAECHVVAVARNEKLLQELKAQHGNKISTIVLDVSSSDAHLREALAPFHPFHFLVNNAGIAICEGVFKIQQESIEKSVNGKANIPRTFAVNVTAPLLLAQIVAEQMVAHHVKGSIVQISSQASTKPMLAHAVYSSSKAALDMMTRSLALELGPHGIRINNVNPTVVLTEMGKRNWSDQKKVDDLLSKMPLRKFAEEQDCVNAVLFLLSDQAGMTTGAIFPVDGGFMSQ